MWQVWYPVRILDRQAHCVVVEVFEEVQFQKNNVQKKVDTRMHIARNTGTLILISHIQAFLNG